MGSLKKKEHIFKLEGYAKRSDLFQQFKRIYKNRPFPEYKEKAEMLNGGTLCKRKQQFLF